MSHLKKAIVLDIEGTTSPNSFVHEVLFLYARHHVKEYLSANFNSPDVQADIEKLRVEHSMDVEQNLDPPALVNAPCDAEIDSLVSYINWLIDRDRKSPGLKSLQGKIWKQGYLDGTLKAPVFEDVAPALQRWHETGVKVAIFSSGSALAQKLLFAHTEAGDLTKLIDHYFDTAIGSKTDSESYRRIASVLDVPAAEVLFISDIVAELDAASAAGMQTLLCIRPGNPPQPEPIRHRIVHNFHELDNGPHL